MSMPVHGLVEGGRGDEFRFISGWVFHLVKVNKMCQGGHVKQKSAGGGSFFRGVERDCHTLWARNDRSYHPSTAWGCKQAQHFDRVGL